MWQLHGVHNVCYSQLKTFQSCSVTTPRRSWLHGLYSDWLTVTATSCTMAGKTFSTACCSCSELNFLPKSSWWSVLLFAVICLLKTAVFTHTGFASTVYVVSVCLCISPFIQQTRSCKPRDSCILMPNIFMKFSWDHPQWGAICRFGR